MKRFISIFLSSLILISSMGITFSTHFCMDRAVDNELMIGMHELSCGMMDMDANCETAGTNIMAPGCCDNEFISVEIQDKYELLKEDFSLEPSFLFTYTFLFDQLKINEPSLAYADHYPPPLEQDFQSLYQCFLL